MLLHMIRWKQNILKAKNRWNAHLMDNTDFMTVAEMEGGILVCVCVCVEEPWVQEMKVSYQKSAEGRGSQVHTL